MKAPLPKSVARRCYPQVEASSNAAIDMIRVSKTIWQKTLHNVPSNPDLPPTFFWYSTVVKTKSFAKANKN